MSYYVQVTVHCDSCENETYEEEDFELEPDSVLGSAIDEGWKIGKYNDAKCPTCQEKD